MSAMADNEIILSVIDDTSLRTWLDRVVDNNFRMEFVGRSDVGRVLRLLEATTAHVVLVEVNEEELNQSLAIITALTSARPWLTVITVCARSNQELLLQSMRAGARDCLVAGQDATEVRDRLRRHQLVRAGHYDDENRSTTGNLILVTGADASVDTRFLTQNLAIELSRRDPKSRTLAIDTQSERGCFYLDSHSQYTLENLLASPETLDETLINTALEEFRPGLRLLSGGQAEHHLGGDRSADLFIALNGLMQMFDRIVVNIGNLHSEHWIRALGIHTQHLLVAIHPLVDHAHAARGLISDWRSHIGSQGQMKVVVDGYVNGVPPSSDELAETSGAPLAGTLPMDWKYRVLAINSGQTMQDQAPRSSYCRQMASLLTKLGERDLPQNQSGGWLRRVMAKA